MNAQASQPVAERTQVCAGQGMQQRLLVPDYSALFPHNPPPLLPHEASVNHLPKKVISSVSLSQDLLLKE